MGQTFSYYYRVAFKRFKSDLLNEADPQIPGTTTDKLFKYYFDISKYYD